MNLRERGGDWSSCGTWGISSDGESGEAGARAAGVPGLCPGLKKLRASG